MYRFPNQFECTLQHLECLLRARLLIFIRMYQNGNFLIVFTYLLLWTIRRDAQYAAIIYFNYNQVYIMLGYSYL